MNGIEKEIDNLGRVVIPASFRKKLGIESNARVFISLEDDVITISPSIKHCALCGKKLNPKHRLRLCDACVLKIKSEN